MKSEGGAAGAAMLPDSVSESEDTSKGLPEPEDSQYAVFLCSATVCFCPQGLPDGKGSGQR